MADSKFDGYLSAEDTPEIGGDISSVRDSISGSISNTRYNSSNYEELHNKPSIEGVTLIGNKTLADLGISDISAKWGKITGNMDDQADLAAKFREQDDKALTVQEIEKILYLN